MAGKPPSPVPPPYHSSHRKTPTPPPPPELTRGRASPARALAGASSARPLASDRTSPTQSSKGSGGTSPVVEVQSGKGTGAASWRQAARSMSATPSPAPALHPPASPSARVSMIGPRSKSVASEPHQARCQGEARRPEARRPVPCETLDNWTQTDEELNTAPADGAAGAWDTGGEVAYQVDDLADEPPGTAAGAGGDVAPSSASTFLRRPMEYMAELEMAIRSTVEVFAENMEINLQRHAVTFPEPRAPAHGVRSHASQSRAARFLGLGRQLTGAAASSPEHHHRGTPLAEEGSDGEDGHADDAEVSLTL